MLVRVVIFSLLVILVLSKNIKDEKSTDFQDTLGNLISRLGSPMNNNSENVLFMPPTFSVDIVSLLRWAVENTPAQQQDIRPRYSSFPNERSSRTLKPTDHFYPKSFLNLVEFNGKSYFFCKNQKLSWVEALSFCRSFGMDLISIETREEDEFIISEIIQAGLVGSFIWTSANKIGRSTFLWINGEQLIYENWESGEPGVPALQHCLILYNKKWHDIECHQNTAHTRDAFFICESR